MNKLLQVVFLGLLFSSVAGAADIDGMIESGDKYWSEGKLEEAESVFREAIRLEPGSALPHARLAGLLLGQNRNDEARVEYQNAIMNDPENPAFFLALAIVYLHEKAYSEAQAMIDVALELSPDNESAGKLQKYVVAKMSMLEEAGVAGSSDPVAVPRDAMHGSPPSGTVESVH